MEGVEEKYGISTLGIYKITSDDYNPTVLPGGGDGEFIPLYWITWRPNG